MFGLNKSAISTLPIADFIADFLRDIENQPFQYGRNYRKVADFWPFSKNRQFICLQSVKSAMLIADFIAEKIK